MPFSLLPFSSSPWFRRIGMPLVILLVGLALAVWSARRQVRQNQEIHHLVVEVCDDVSAGRKPTSIDPLISRTLISTLQPIVEDATPLTVVVRPGDTDQRGSATHTAMLSLDGRDVLRLRVVHRGRIEDAVIIGFWLNPDS